MREPEPREVPAEEAAATAAISTADPMVAAFVRRAGPFALRPGDQDPLTSLFDLATKTRDGTVPLDGIDAFGDDEIVERLTKVRGIGRWTAEMFLLFQLRRPDVWPVDDLGIRHGWSLIHTLPETIKPRPLQAEGERFRPYRSTLALYCWHAVHVERGQA